MIIIKLLVKDTAFLYIEIHSFDVLSAIVRSRVTAVKTESEGVGQKFAYLPVRTKATVPITINGIRVTLSPYFIMK